MLLAICSVAGRNAVGDSFKNIVNSFQKKQNVVCVIPPAYLEEEFSSDFLLKIPDEFTSSSSKYFTSIAFAKKLKNIIKKEKIDKIFIYFDNHWFNMILFFFLKDFNCKLFMWVHDPILHLGANWKEKVIRHINKLVLLQYIDKFIVSYESGIKELEKKYGVNEAKVEVIYLPRMLELEFEDVKRKLIDIKYDFIFFGRLEEYKGINLLVAAFAILKDKKLLLIGNGDCSTEVYEQIAQCNNITFINEYVPNKKLAEYIKESKWVILPYKMATGSQTVQIANYYGKPVLATKVGCFREYVVEGVNGFFIEEYSIKSIVNAIQLCSDQIYDGKNMFIELEKNFSLRIVTKKLEKIFSVEN